MAARNDRLSGEFLGSNLATEVFFQLWPFQCATSVPPTAQMLVADSALASVSPLPEATLVQLDPLKCQAWSGNADGAENIQTSVLLIARLLPGTVPNFLTFAHLVPLKPSARPLNVKAHTLRADED